MQEDQGWSIPGSVEIVDVKAGAEGNVVRLHVDDALPRRLPEHLIGRSDCQIAGHLHSVALYGIPMGDAVPMLQAICEEGEYVLVAVGLLIAAELGTINGRFASAVCSSAFD
jgi:hypothetical protein